MPKEAGGDKPVTISDGTNSLSWSIPVGGEASAQVAEAAPEALTARADAAADGDGTNAGSILDDAQLKTGQDNSEITYSDADTGVDYRYQLDSTTLKESVILNQQPDADASYSFDLQSGGLTAEKLDSGEVAFKDEGGNTVFTIRAPYMFDADNNRSDAVEVTLEPIDGGYRYTLKPDGGWLGDDSRAYPATIDPTVGADDSQLHDASVSSVLPNNNFGSDSVLYVGTIENGGTVSQHYAYLQFPHINEVSAASQIVGAGVQLHNTGAVYHDSDNQINLYRVTSAWDETTLTWNNQPSAADAIVDYAISNGGEDDYDITSLVQDWYTGGNDYGIALKPNTVDTGMNAASYCSSEGASEAPDLEPIAYIQYRNADGLENQWTYTSMDAGRSNVASVNNLNGNFVVSAPIVSASGNREPVSLSCVYNTSPRKSSYAPLGYGWQLNYDMMLYKETDANLLANYPYYFKDGDGTIHYFCNYKDDSGSTQIKDEDGLGYTLTTNSSGYTVTDKSGGKMHFNNLGQLDSITDTNSNQITINHGGTVENYRISSIQDGAGRTYTLQYDGGSNKILSITDPSNRAVTFGYTGSYLTSITYPDGKSTRYQYDYTQDTSKDETYGGVLQRITAADGTYTSMTYSSPAGSGDTAANRRRVLSMNACAADGTVQSYYTFTYRCNYTQIVDQNRQHVDYEFNNYGQTIDVVDESDSTGQYYSFGKPGGNDGTDNKLLSSSKTESSVTNYLTNGGMSSSLAGWTNYYSKTGQSYTAAYCNGGYPSVGCLRIIQTSSNPGTVWENQDITGLAEGYYTLSAYVSTEGQTLTGSGALVYAEAVNGSGAIQRTASSDYVTSTGSTEWKRISATVYVGSGEKLRFYAGYDSGTVGTVYMDSFQVEKGESANSYNMIENSEFNNGLNGWTGSGQSSHDYLSGRNVAAISGDVSSAHSLYQSFSGTFRAGDVFTFGGWASASSVPTGAQKGAGHTPTYRLRACFYMGGNLVGTSTLNFDSQTDYWQYLCGEARCPYDCNELRLYFDYDYNTNTAIFTDAQLYREQFGQTYTYDKDGNLTSSVDLSNAQASFAYKNDQLSKLLNPTGDRYLYTYDETTKNLKYASSTNGQRYAATYDQYGNPTSSKTNADKFASSLTSGQVYYIRNAYSGNALDNGSGASGHAVYNYTWHPEVAAQQWKVVATADPDVYILYATHNSSLVLDVTGGTSADNAPMELYSYIGSSAQCYKILANGDGTFRILTKCSNYTKCVDGEPGDSTDTSNDSHVYQYSYADGDEGQEWYFTPYTSNLDSSGYLSASATYTSNGNYLSTVTDGRGKTITYNYDTTKGLLNSTKDPRGYTTSYTYDSNTDKILSIASGTQSAAYSYANDRLSSVSHNGVVYNLQYDKYGRQTATTVGNGTASQTLATNAYNAQNQLSSVTYGNGSLVSYTYNQSGQLTGTEFNNDSSKTVALSYNAQNLLGLKKDSLSGLRTRYTYDLSGRLVDTRSTVGCDTDNGALNLDTSLKYEDGTNRLLSTVWSFLSRGSKKTVTTGYTYGSVANGTMPTAVYSLSLDGRDLIDYTYDSLGRKNQRVINTGDDTDTTIYGYVSGVNANQTTALLNNIKNTNGTKSTSYSYDYDNDGNIKNIYENGTLTQSYVYDSLNQLTRANDFKAATATFYTYDQGGNLLTSEVYPYIDGTLSPSGTTISYGYGNSTWKDLMTSYNGQTITYDTIGNPLQYRDGMTMTWQNGRQLAGISKNGLNVTYTYNGDGIRTGKTVNGVKTSFIVDGSTIVSQQGTAESGAYAINYLYDENGKAYGFYYNDDIYYYEFDGQGDVVSLLNHHGDLAASYTYDTWGKLLSVKDCDGRPIMDPSDVANLNIFLYRGYCYDTETGLYYLQSRYYDPNTGRFISQDGLIGSIDTNSSILGNNIFVYSNNNPINYIDAKGTTAWYIGLTGHINFGIFGVTGSIYFCMDSHGNMGIQASSGYQSGGLDEEGGGIIVGIVWGADTIKDLEGPSISYGASVGIDGASVGIDLIYYQNGDSTPDGVQFFIGPGSGIDIHASVTSTGTIWSTLKDIESDANNCEILCGGTVYIKDLSRPYNSYKNCYGDTIWVGSGYANNVWYERISINSYFIGRF